MKSKSLMVLASLGVLGNATQCFAFCEYYYQRAVTQHSELSVISVGSGALMTAAGSPVAGALSTTTASDEADSRNNYKATLDLINEAALGDGPRLRELASTIFVNGHFAAVSEVAAAVNKANLDGQLCPGGAPLSNETAKSILRLVISRPNN